MERPARRQEATMRSRFGAETQRDGIHLLVVTTDSDWVRTVTDAFDQAENVDVTQSERGSAALELLADRDITCVISDADLPEMGGIGFLATVRAEFPSLPFVLCTDDELDGTAQRALRIGADDVVQKSSVEACQNVLTRRIENCVALSREEKSLQTLRQAVENAGHAVFITDRDGTITYANPSMAETAGYTVDELLGETPALLKSGEHDEAFYQDLWGTILGGEVWQSEVINERKDGEQYVIDQTISPMTDATGTITGFVAINREVSERKERERNLAFFEQAVGQIGTGMAAYDADGTVQYANRAYAEMLGATVEALEGIHVAALNPEFDSEGFDEYWDSFSEGETRETETVHQRLDDNTQFPVDTVTTHIDIGDEEYHIGTIRDITERKEREQDLRLFRQAVEHAGHAVFITDPEGTIEYVNPAFEAITGYSASEACGRTPAILKSGEHDEAFYEDLWETILGGEVWEGEIINERIDGSRFHIEQTIAPLTDDDGEITHFVGINNDISEMKEYERELERQNDRLEQFGRTVAHDLRNPLNVLRMRLDDARQTDDPCEAHDEIACSVDRMEELIDELLMLAKQGQTVLNPTPVPLEDVARTAWSHVDTAAMTLEVADEPTVLVDESRATELFGNLFRNAREHAGPDARLCVGSLDDGFYVADDGPGIPPQDRDRVLESGFTTSKEGTGFGLSIVSQIADAHDWDVSVTDSETGGARFEFRSVEFE
ncbi:PAS domain S-box protein [Salinibaculum rarum]|uniref:hybrid sensor histidine kinase/response regulator n=1 Tax=Salinibaculum rarum TaxID=3058903 RepID=UPI00265FFB4C|nr:PAS domain S-box protein [Salinibaculum sp. KK48]